MPTRITAANVPRGELRRLPGNVLEVNRALYLQLVDRRDSRDTPTVLTIIVTDD